MSVDVGTRLIYIVGPLQGGSGQDDGQLVHVGQQGKGGVGWGGVGQNQIIIHI